jgi:Protein of unknown function (DUF3102)
MRTSRNTSQDKRDTAPKADTFDYTSVPEDLATKLRKQAARIKEKMKATVSAIIEVGRDLRAVKQQLAHGQFCCWVQAECGFTTRSAQKYMQSAELADKNELSSHLSLSVLYLISAKSAPTEVVTEVMSRVESGKVVSEAVVKAMLTKAKEKRERNDRRSNAGGETGGALGAKYEEKTRAAQDHAKTLLDQLVAKHGASAVIEIANAVNAETYFMDEVRKLSTNASGFKDDDRAAPPIPAADGVIA